MAFGVFTCVQQMHDGRRGVGVTATRCYPNAGDPARVLALHEAAHVSVPRHGQQLGADVSITEKII
jgi:hypothetical protein